MAGCAKSRLPFVSSGAFASGKLSQPRSILDKVADPFEVARQFARIFPLASVPCNNIMTQCDILGRVSITGCISLSDHGGDRAKRAANSPSNFLAHGSRVEHSAWGRGHSDLPLSALRGQTLGGGSTGRPVWSAYRGLGRSGHRVRSDRSVLTQGEADRAWRRSFRPQAVARAFGVSSCFCDREAAPRSRSQTE